jgi:hypothetical protein
MCMIVKQGPHVLFCMPASILLISAIVRTSTFLWQRGVDSHIKLLHAHPSTSSAHYSAADVGSAGGLPPRASPGEPMGPMPTDANASCSTSAKLPSTSTHVSWSFHGQFLREQPRQGATHNHALSCAAGKDTARFSCTRAITELTLY